MDCHHVPRVEPVERTAMAPYSKSSRTTTATRVRCRRFSPLSSVGMNAHIYGRTDPGLHALMLLLRLHGIVADGGQIRHRTGEAAIGTAEMLRCAKDLGLKARLATTKMARLLRTPLPAIATLRNGGFLVVEKTDEDKVLVRQPLGFADACPVMQPAALHLGCVYVDQLREQ
jgi:hypothetical protein